MRNPFIPDRTNSPYRWNAFQLTKIRRTEWGLQRVQQRIRKAMQKAQGRNPRTIDDVQVTEESINNIRDTFSAPRSRLAHEILLHTEHEGSPSKTAEHGEQIRQWIRAPMPLERRLTLDTSRLCGLIPSAIVEPVSALPTSTREATPGPRPAEVTLDFITKELV